MRVRDLALTCRRIDYGDIRATNFGLFVSDALVGGVMGAFPSILNLLFLTYPVATVSFSARRRQELILQKIPERVIEDDLGFLYIQVEGVVEPMVE